jgi:3-oxoacyl-[acyl-carrier protein] reductase
MRNVVVTGGSRGIGRGIVQALALAGYRAIAVARSAPQDLAATDADTGEIAFEKFDLENFDAIPDFVRRLRKQHGPIYGLVNNAGISVEGMLSRIATDDIERVVRLNTLAPMILTKHVVRQMMASGEGRIVNMSSIVASTGYSGLSVYSATKASMVGFTRSLARELGPAGITVNAVAPGFVDTELTAHMAAKDRDRVARRTALQRLPGVEDVARAVLYLMDEAARNVTGTVLTVDAGATA